MPNKSENFKLNYFTIFTLKLSLQNFSKLITIDGNQQKRKKFKFTPRETRSLRIFPQLNPHQENSLMYISLAICPKTAAVNSKQERSSRKSKELRSKSRPSERRKKTFMHTPSSSPRTARREEKKDSVCFLLLSSVCCVWLLRILLCTVCFIFLNSFADTVAQQTFERADGL
jgi:hypothetical protein